MHRLYEKAKVIYNAMFALCEQINCIDYYYEGHHNDPGNWPSYLIFPYKRPNSNGIIFTVRRT